MGASREVASPAQHHEVSYCLVSPASSPTASAVFTPLTARSCCLPLRPSARLSTISPLVMLDTITTIPTTGSETTSTIPGLLGDTTWGWGGSTPTLEAIPMATTTSAWVSTIPTEDWATFRLLPLLLLLLQ